VWTLRAASHATSLWHLKCTLVHASPHSRVHIRCDHPAFHFTMWLARSQITCLDSLNDDFRTHYLPTRRVYNTLPDYHETARRPPPHHLKPLGRVNDDSRISSTQRHGLPWVQPRDRRYHRLQQKLEALYLRFSWISLCVFLIRSLFLQPIMSRTAVSVKCAVDPFSLDHAFADCDMPLSNRLSKRWCWKHLDDVLRAQCRCGPDPTHEQGSPSTGLRNRVVATQFEFEVIVNHLLALHDPAGTPEHIELPIHDLRLIISGFCWVANSSVGTFRSEASDFDADDVASFALLDTLTRWLPHWQGGILLVHTNDGCIVRGILRMFSGLWAIVQALCAQYGVQLRARMVEHPDIVVRLRSGCRTSSPKALRNLDVVDAAIKLLAVSGPRDNTAYRKIVKHLTE